jgi:hypothetical protein
MFVLTWLELAAVDVVTCISVPPFFAWCFIRTCHGLVSTCSCVCPNRPPRPALIEQYRKKEQELAAAVYVAADAVRYKFYQSPCAVERNDALGILVVKVFRQVCLNVYIVHSPFTHHSTFFHQSFVIHRLSSAPLTNTLFVTVLRWF